MNHKAIINGLKELGRLIVLGIPALVIQIISGNSALAASYGGTVLFVLKSIDRYIHDNPKINKNGLLPF